MKGKKLIRERFRNDVFERDNHKCKVCGNSAQDAHHITDRNEMPNGGYVKENGISLCSDCHIKAEQYHITDGKNWINGYHPSELYGLINSSYEIAYKKSELI